MPKKFDAEKVLDVLEMFRGGKSYKEIARENGVAYGTFQRWFAFLSGRKEFGSWGVTREGRAFSYTPTYLQDVKDALPLEEQKWVEKELIRRAGYARKVASQIGAEATKKKWTKRIRNETKES